MRINFCLLLGLLSLSIFADTISIKSVNGEYFEVEKSELRKAYYNMGDGRGGKEGKNVTWNNDDGSVTIEDPRFRHRGHKLPFGMASYNTTQVANIVCKFLGYQKSTLHSVRRCGSSDLKARTTAESTTEQCVGASISEYSGTIRLDKLIATTYLIESVTCIKTSY
jgi:hypothetical protein